MPCPPTLPYAVNGKICLEGLHDNEVRLSFYPIAGFRPQSDPGDLLFNIRGDNRRLSAAVRRRRLGYRCNHGVPQPDFRPVLVLSIALALRTGVAIGRRECRVETVGPSRRTRRR